MILLSILITGEDEDVIYYAMISRQPTESETKTLTTGSSQSKRITSVI